MTNFDSVWLSTFLVGLFGSAHCFGMCGGIAATIRSEQNQNNRQQLLVACFYNLGRIMSYTLIGALFAGFFTLLGKALDIPYWSQTLRTITGLLLIGIGLHISIRWQGLKYLETVGAALWKHLAPMAQKLIPIRSKRNAFYLGLLWGWLPCGLVYSVLATASSSGSFITGAFYMACFGLGTLPAMLGISIFSLKLHNMLQSKKLKMLSGLSIIIFGIWTIFAVWAPSQHHLHHMH